MECVFPVHPLWRFLVDLLWAVGLVPLRNQSTGRKTESPNKVKFGRGSFNWCSLLSVLGPSSERTEKKLALPGTNSGIWLQNIESSPFLFLTLLSLNARERERQTYSGFHCWVGEEVLLKTLSASLWVFDLRVAYVSTKRRYWESLSMKTQLPSWI